MTLALPCALETGDKSAIRAKESTIQEAVSMMPGQVLQTVPLSSDP